MHLDITLLEHAIMLYLDVSITKLNCCHYSALFTEIDQIVNQVLNRFEFRKYLELSHWLADNSLLRSIVHIKKKVLHATKTGMHRNIISET